MPQYENTVQRLIRRSIDLIHTTINIESITKDRLLLDLLV